ncbi:phosphatase PAP2 family protein [Lacibacter sp. H407]|uniref:phosphatase PAP2 family protein n=1 Tax=Lacibacter sp. H407 TaxID=3133423 RepID=UPI0030C4E24B
MNWKYNHPTRNLFTYATILFLLLGAAALFYWNKEQVFLWLNHQHTYTADVILKYFTYIGDGIFMIGLGLVLLLFRFRKLGVLMLLSFLLSGLLAQSIKRIEARPRPGLHFQNPDIIHRVDDVLLKGKNSFPSGHTTTAFATFSLLAFATRNKFVQFLYFAIAVTIGYSRIYLGQHFAEDVLMGAAVGFLSSFFLSWLLRKKDWD